MGVEVVELRGRKVQTQLPREKVSECECVVCVWLCVSYLSDIVRNVQCNLERFGHSVFVGIPDIDSPDNVSAYFSLLLRRVHGLVIS